MTIKQPLNNEPYRTTAKRRVTTSAVIPRCTITTPHNHSSFDDPIICPLRGDEEPPASAAPRRRLRECVEAWPECHTGGYDPRCCRFPKSCSCDVYLDEQVTDEDLEPVPDAASLCAEVYDYALGPTVVTCQRPPHDDKHHRASLDDGLNFTTITWTPHD